MGGSVSCCISPGESPKVHRRQLELEECPITTTEDVSEDTGTYLQHISDRELPEGGSITPDAQKTSELRHLWFNIIAKILLIYSILFVFS